MYPFLFVFVPIFFLVSIPVFLTPFAIPGIVQLPPSLVLVLLYTTVSASSDLFNPMSSGPECPLLSRSVLICHSTPSAWVEIAPPFPQLHVSVQHNTPLTAFHDPLRTSPDVSR